MVLAPHNNHCRSVWLTPHDYVRQGTVSRSHTSHLPPSCIGLWSWKKRWCTPLWKTRPLGSFSPWHSGPAWCLMQTTSITSPSVKLPCHHSGLAWYLICTHAIMLALRGYLFCTTASAACRCHVYTLALGWPVRTIQACPYRRSHCQSTFTQGRARVNTGQ